MIQYRLRIINKALADMDAIYEYIAEILQAPDTELKQYNCIADGIELLSEILKRSKLFESLPERDLGFRQPLVDNYSAIYVVDGDCVTVLRVLYSSPDIINRLRK